MWSSDAEHHSVNQHATSAAEAPDSQAGRTRLFLAVSLPFFALFLATARTDLPYHIDAATNVFTAWAVGSTGSPVLHDYEELADPVNKGVFAWVVQSERGPVSQYPPGTALLAAPLYALWPEATDVSLSAENAAPDTRVTVPIPSLWPAALVAAGTTAAALGLVALMVTETGGSTRMAAMTAIVGGLGTSTWSVAADQLWQHGPNMLWTALGIYLSARNRWGWAGLAFGALALTRPPVVLVGAGLGVMLVLQGEIRSALRLLTGVTPGIVALLAYNRWLFGSPSVSGGYGNVYAERAASSEVTGYLANIGSAMFNFGHGLFVWSPFVMITMIGALAASKRLPTWTAASALGGLVYLLVQLRLNRASGGEGFSYYRYPLEPLTAAAPLLAVGWERVWAVGRPSKLLLVATTAFAVAAHTVAAI